MTAKKEQKQNFLTPPLEWAIASVAGLISGAAGVITDIRGRFHDNIKKTEVFAPLFARHDAEMTKLVGDSLAPGVKELLGTQNTEVLIEGLKKLPTPVAAPFIKGWADNKNAFTHVNELMLEKGYGIYSNGLKGITLGNIQRFETLSKVLAQPQVAFRGAIATFIGVAGTKMALNSFHTRDKLDEIHGMLAEQEQSR